MIYGPGGEGRAHVTGAASASVHDNYIVKNGGLYFYADPNARTKDIYSGDINMATGARIDAR
jgi:hypothetical protein